MTTQHSVGPAVPALTDMSVQEMIDATPLGPILDQPVGEILAGLGLPPLPQLPPLPPLPGLPPLPTIDLAMLFKPLTDLLGGFGTGDLSTAGFDPSMVFEGLSKVLETSLSMSQGALEALDKLWTGQASVSAAAKTTEAGANSAALSGQGSGISFNIQAAAGIVATGLATVQAIIAATIGKVLVIGPGLLTPVGQGAAVLFANEGLAEATTAVAVTRAQLLGPTTSMTVNGAPVAVTSAPTTATAPTTQSPFAMASTILQAVSPVLTTAAELPSTLSTPVQKMLTLQDKEIPDIEPARMAHPERVDDPDHTGPSPGATSPASLGGAPMPGGIGPMATPLGPARASMPVPGTTEPAGYVPGTATKTAVTAAPATMPASMAPMAGAAGAARGAGAADEHHEIPDYLVTEDNGQQVVGEVGGVAPPVLGDDQPAAPAPAPDIELRLGVPAPDLTT